MAGYPFDFTQFLPIIALISHRLWVWGGYAFVLKLSALTSSLVNFSAVRGLANYIIGKSSNLRFNIPDFEIKRMDDVELRDKMMKMTPEKIRKLGLRRNTLWYIKKNLKEGKRARVYKKIMSKLV